MALQFLKKLFDPTAFQAEDLMRNKRLQQVAVILGYMAIAAGIVFAIKSIYPVVLWIVTLVTPFVVAFLLAYICNPGLLWFQRRLKMSREGVLVIATVSLAGVMALGLFFLMLLLFEQGYSLVLKMSEVPTIVEQRQSDLRKFLNSIEQNGLSGVFGSRSGGGENAHGIVPEHIVGIPTPALPPVPENQASGTPEAGEMNRGVEATPIVEPRVIPERTVEPSAPSQSDTVRTSSGLLEQFSTAASGAGMRFAAGLGELAIWLLNGLMSGLVLLSFIGVITFFMLLDFESLCRGFWQLVPFRWRDRTADVLGQIDFALGGYLRGQMLVCVIIGATWACFLMAMGLWRYALLLGAVAGVMTAIPYLGSTTALVTGVGYVILAGWDGPGGLPVGILLVLAGFTAVQVLEGMVLQPVLVGSRAQLSPLIVILALALGSTFGLPGMVLAMPAAAIARVLLVEFFWRDWAEEQRVAREAVGEEDPAVQAFGRMAAMRRALDERIKSAHAAVAARLDSEKGAKQQPSVPDAASTSAEVPSELQQAELDSEAATEPPAGRPYTRKSTTAAASRRRREKP